MCLDHRLSIWFFGFWFCLPALGVDFYRTQDEALPQIDKPQTVYLGERMLRQRSGYYQECIRAKKSFSFVYDFPDTELCLLSKQYVERKGLGWTVAIPKDALMCGTRKRLTPVGGWLNYLSKHNNSSFDLTLKENKGDKTLRVGMAKVVKIPKSDFDARFPEVKPAIRIHQGSIWCAGSENSPFKSDQYDSGLAELKAVTKLNENPLVDVNIIHPSVLNGEGGFFLDRTAGIMRWGRQDAWQLSSKDQIELFEKDTKYVVNSDSLQRVVEYAGKSGSVLRFLYSEFADGNSRQAFNREFQVDLNDGDLGAYKGAVFKIIEANNATITYKIIRHFPFRAEAL